MSPQLDVIVADRLSSNPVFQGHDGTEYVPYEAVYAIGEVKTSYHKSDKPIQGFSKTISRIQADLKRQPTRRNPLFSFMFFADSNEFKLDDVEEFYRTSAVEHLPCMVCFLDGGTIFHARFARNGQGGRVLVVHHLCPATDAESGNDNHWTLIRWREMSTPGTVNLMFLEVALMQHVRLCDLASPNLLAYLARHFVWEGGELI